MAKTNYWQHRIKGGDYALPLSTPLLFDHHILSIGWSDINDASFLARIKGIKAWEEFESQLRETYRHLWTNRYSLWRYLNEMKAGDIVVVPTPHEFSIYRILDNTIMTSEELPQRMLVDWWNRRVKQENGYLIDVDGNQIDLGFFRKVEPIVEHLGRDKCDKTLYKKMKAHQTNINLYGVKDFVDDVIRQYGDIDEEEYEEDFYSPTSWEKDPFETDEEYQDRMQDQEDLLEYYDEQAKSGIDRWFGLYSQNAK